jgi:hypothetical protein
MVLPRVTFISASASEKSADGADRRSAVLIAYPVLRGHKSALITKIIIMLSTLHAVIGILMVVEY